MTISTDTLLSPAARRALAELVREVFVDLLRYDPYVRGALCEALQSRIVQEALLDRELLGELATRITDNLMERPVFTQKVASCVRGDVEGACPTVR